MYPFVMAAWLVLYCQRSPGRDDANSAPHTPGSVCLSSLCTDKYLMHVIYVYRYLPGTT